MKTLANQLNKEPTTQELLAQIEALRQANQALLDAQKVTVKNGLKISEKGAVSLYGLGKFPISLYAEQWRKIFAQSQTILDFIADGERQGRIVPKSAKPATNA